MTGYSVLNAVRRRCREVAEQAAFVEIDTAAVAGYAARLPPDRLRLPEMDGIELLARLRRWIVEAGGDAFDRVLGA